MTKTQEILKLIEEVDPSDTEKLDEIDARIWCWIYNFDFKTSYGNGFCCADCAWDNSMGSFQSNDCLISEIPQYTRSLTHHKEIKEKAMSRYE